MNTETEAKHKPDRLGRAQAQSRPIDETCVGDYLLAHPDFFERHPELLTRLEITHPTGDAVSLIERQVELLRHQNSTLERRLVDLVEVARGNDSVIGRLHKLAVALLGAEETAERVQVLEDHLRGQFGADHTRLYLFAGQLDELGLDTVRRVNRAELGKFKRFLEEDKPFCGRLRPAQLEYLFAEQAARVSSVALVPLGPRARLGMMALGSEKPDHFNPTLGTLFLARVGELTEHALGPILK